MTNNIIHEGQEMYLSSAQIMAAVIGGRNALMTAQRLIQDIGDLTAIASTTILELMGKGLSIRQAEAVKAACELGKRLMAYRISTKRRVISSKDIFDVYRHNIHYFQGLKKEVFKLIMLDGKNRIFSDYVVSEGCLTSSIVHPREVYIQAIRNSAASVIFMHNHPSGDPAPSPEDIEITKRLVSVGDLVGIKVLDHIIMGDGEYLSFADKGLL